MTAPDVTAAPAASLIQALTILAGLVDPEIPGAEEIAGGRATQAWALASLRSLHRRSPEAFGLLPLESLKALMRAMLAAVEAEGVA